MVGVIGTLGKMGGAGRTWEINSFHAQALHSLYMFQAQLES